MHRGRLGEPEDSVVAGVRRTAAVAVAGREVDRAVGAVLNFAQTAEFVEEEVLDVEDPPRIDGVEAHADEPFAAEGGEEEVALERGSRAPVTKEAPEGAIAGVN
jgi:hypothetical protein